jgi:hypothetical protein
MESKAFLLVIFFMKPAEHSLGQCSNLQSKAAHRCVTFSDLEYNHAMSSNIRICAEPAPDQYSNLQSKAAHMCITERERIIFVTHPLNKEPS